MLEALQMSLSPAALLGFSLYMLGAILILALFKFAYTRITPHNEYELIRKGNVAAAIALSGAAIGFALPVSNVIEHSISLIDFAVWALIAAAVQLAAFFIIGRVLSGLAARIEAGDIAAAIYIAGVSIAIGMLNAACMTPASA
jgi:putative membrane protein